MSVAVKSAIVSCEIPACDVEPGIEPKDIHVLLVDDEVLSRMVVANMLQKSGYQVTAVETGRDALEKLADPNQPYTLLLTDVAMPGITGLQILKLVRNTPELDHVPVVMMSAHQNAGTIFECVRMGADDYMLKPVGEKEVYHLWQHVYRRQMVVKSRRRLAEGQEADHLPRASTEEPLAAEGSIPTKTGAPTRHGSLSESVDFREILPEEATEDKSKVMSVEEMRLYCNTMIEKYQKVLYVIENYPELFPAAKRSKSTPGAAGTEGCAQASTADVDSLAKSTGEMTV